MILIKRIRPTNLWYNLFIKSFSLLLPYKISSEIDNFPDAPLACEGELQMGAHKMIL